MTTLNMEWMKWPETALLVQALESGDIAFRFVGGCVRDALLGIAAGDIDIATAAPPEAIQNQLTSNGIKNIPTGIAHGTITAVIGKRHFEITTLRKDVSTDGRHAVVEFTEDWQQDAARRDFTLNALYADTKGAITDYHGGIEDAKNGVVRFIGNAETRITEDALRILRFFRFSARYAKGDLDENGLRACEKKRALLDALSGERIQSEMFKLLKAERANEMLAAMQTRHILPHIIPANCRPAILKTLRETEQNATIAPDSIRAIAALLRSDEHPSPSAASQLAGRWKLSNTDKKTLHLLTENRISSKLSDVEAKRHIRRMGRELFTSHLLLSAAENKTAATAIASALALSESWTPPIFPVSGDDLLAKGYQSGAALGEALAKLEAIWEDGGYSLSKDELLSRL